ncbi:response regulator [Undibacterium jejuense]|uniref:Response regulator n=1 Tax=Undibacterium jejuense TaxID=1344949 RepID=A0A923HBR1_9BURK|nr:response regulator [Undibacterium jejuense]MBC3861547.1 response regulator [Undibacterium jejuense]
MGTERSNRIKRALNVLVVDDDYFLQRTLVLYLNSFGHSGIVVENGQKALACLFERNFDVILLDVTMPVMDGLEVLSAIRSKEKLTKKHQLIIMVTGYAEAGDIDKLKKAGADGYITKPINPAQLESELERLIV